MTPVPKIRATAQRSDIIRRVISDDDWNNNVIARIAEAGREVPVWVGDKTWLVRTGNNGNEVYDPNLRYWGAVEDEVASLKANGELLAPQLRREPTYVENPSKAKTFTVTEFANEPLSLVHHTMNNDKSDPHLTVENAHVLAVQDILSPAGSPHDARSKAKLDKSTVNDAIMEHGAWAVDNLNFYGPSREVPREDKAKTDHERMPLSRYLAFIVRALEVGGAPAEYGQRIVGYADELATRKKLVPSQLFMRAEMDEPAFVRAVFIIDSCLPSGRGLTIDQGVREVFAQYWQAQGRDEAYLPEPDDEFSSEPRRPLTMLRAGMPFGKDSYSAIEGRYARKYFKDLVKAVNAFAPAASIQQPAADVKKPGRGGKTPTATTPQPRATQANEAKPTVEVKQKADTKSKQPANNRPTTSVPKDQASQQKRGQQQQQNKKKNSPNQ